MYRISISQAKAQLSALVNKASQGEEIIITKAGKPIARLIAMEQTKRKPRTPGGLEGQITIAEDFDAPMSKEELALWCDAAIFPSDSE